VARLAGWQVAVLAIRASPPGTTNEQIVTALAISKGESGWDPAAIGDTTITDATWGPSVGLWQSRTLKAERGTGSPRDIDALTGNPQAQAASMASISGGLTNWQPWSVYTGPDGRGSDGPWRQHVPAAEDALDAAYDRFSNDQFPVTTVDELRSASGGALADLALGIDDNVVQPIASAADALAGPLAILTSRSTWLRVGLITGAFVLLIVGILLLSREAIGGVASDVLAARTGGTT